jgi:S-adenosylmethionine/arginine decarboxylase-like enzyme
VGSFILADFYLCRREDLADQQKIEEVFLEMLRNFGESNQKVIIISGVGEGFMGLFKVDGARISFQTFPSYEYLALEVYVLTVSDPSIYVEYIVEKIQPQVVSVREFTRAEHLKTDWK